MSRQQNLIKELVGDQEQTIDCSLRGQALRRAAKDKPPRTLTAWEWEEYYQQHGRPEGHTVTEVEVRVGWWARLRGWWRCEKQRLPDHQG